MGRPKADMQGPGAEERVVEAFWEMLSEMPFPDIKVAALARRARVSPNTIYYHFDGIYDVAHRALESDLDLRFAGAVIAGDAERLAEVGAECGKRLARMISFARSGSAELASMLMDELRWRWMDAAGLSEGDLDDWQRQDLAFAFGGLLAMLAECGPDGDPSVLSGFFSRPLGHGVAETMRRLSGAGFDEGRPARSAATRAPGANATAEASATGAPSCHCRPRRGARTRTRSGRCMRRAADEGQ